MKPVVVDTNVLLVSEGLATHASPECKIACEARLKTLVEAGHVVIDDGWRILREYMNQVNTKRLSVAATFLKWLMQDQKRVAKVILTPVHGGCDTDFAEYPSHPALADFDPADRKFVAVAHAHEPRATILNAVDTDWLAIEAALAELGVRLEHIHGHDLLTKARQKGMTN